MDFDFEDPKVAVPVCVGAAAVLFVAWSVAACIAKRCRKRQAVRDQYPALLPHHEEWLIGAAAAPSSGQFSAPLPSAPALSVPYVSASAPLLAEHKTLPPSSSSQWHAASREVPAAAPAPEGRTCVVCMAREYNVVINPCRHVCLCNECAPKLWGSRCPMCQQPIRGLDALLYA
eukprot:TRINITY_DN27949_c0_g1_i1.p2 TRINITY_DN27949_c0_g1~~TRINITY_DN27949_c0_g1_i1.p2  ORF type:complete len:174 (+),score=23.71 TRINITY_DN27949_c0_g1_i1:159-680(+)